MIYEMFAGGWMQCDFFFFFSGNSALVVSGKLLKVLLVAQLIPKYFTKFISFKV